MASNQFEDLSKGIENFEKQIGALVKHFGFTEKDQSMINEQVNQIAKIFDTHKTSDEILKALDAQVAKAAGDPKKLAGHTIAMQQHIANKTETMKSHAQQSDQDLTIPRPTVG